MTSHAPADDLALSPRSWFLAHVARLTKAKKIFSGVSLLDARKLSERTNMMDRQRLADNFRAGVTGAALLCDDRGADLQPPFASIRCLASHVDRRPLAFKALRILKAFFRAKSGHSILPSKPRFLPERHAAMFAFKRQAVSPSWIIPPLYTFRGESVCRSDAATEIVPNHAGLFASIEARSRVPNASASLRTKPRFGSSVCLHEKRRCADFAGFLDAHAAILTQPKLTAMDSGTSGIACRRIEEASKQADLFIEPPPPKPVQEALL